MYFAFCSKRRRPYVYRLFATRFEIRTSTALYVRAEVRRCSWRTLARRPDLSTRVIVGKRIDICSTAFLSWSYAPTTTNASGRIRILKHFFVSSRGPSGVHDGIAVITRKDERNGRTPICRYTYECV